MDYSKNKWLLSNVFLCDRLRCMYKYPFYLLKVKRFAPFFITQFFGALNDNVFKLSVLTLMAFYLTNTIQDNQFYQALGSGLFTLPFLLFSASAGELADKYDKTVIMRWIKCIEIILMLMGAIGIILQDIPMMFMVIFLMGLHSTFFGPVKYSILPEHLQEEEWLAGNAFVEAGTFIAILIGTIVGTLLIPENSFFLIHGLWLAGASIVSISILGAISSFFIPVINKIHRQVTIDWNPFRATMTVLKESKKYPFVLPAIVGISWFWFIGASFMTEFPVYVKYTLQADKSIFTWLLVLFSVGVATGSVVGSYWLKGKISARYAIFSLLGMSVFTFDLCAQTIFGWRVGIDFFFIALCAGIYVVPLYAIIQKYSPEIWRSRMIAANNVMNAVFMIASAAWIALLTLWHVSVSGVFLSIAALNLFFMVYLYRLSPPSDVSSWTVLSKTILRMVLKCLYRVEVHGLDNYSICQATGKSFFIVTNYTSFFDRLLIATFLPNVSPIVTNLTESSVKKQLRYILKSTQEGYQFMLCPEAYANSSYSLKQLYDTAGFLIRKAAIPILPIQISGALFLPFSRMKGKVPKKYFPKITLTILPSQIMTAPIGFPWQKEKRKISHQLFTLIATMTFDTSFCPMSLWESFLAMRRVHGWRKIAQDIRQKSMTYPQLVTRSLILGRAMKQTTARGEYVGFLLPTMVNSLIVFMALQAFGRVPAMLNFSIGANRLKASCQLANIKAVYTSRVFIDTADLHLLITALHEIGVQVIYLEEYVKHISLGDKITGFLSGLFMTHFPRFVSRENKPHFTDPAVVLFTSGSESSPKGVLLSHQNILANCHQMAANVNFTTEDYLFNALPIFHCFGLMAGMLLPVLQGFPVFLYPSPLHYKMIPEWIKKIGATLFLATDTFLNGYARYSQEDTFLTVRCIFAGAEKVKEETMRKWKKSFGRLIFEGYGLTEASPVLAVNSDVQHKIGTVGCFLPHIHYRFTPVDGIDTMGYEGGRLWVSGPNIMMGYLQMDHPGVLAPVEEGWHDTGDIALIDDEGYLTLLGRAKRFAKIGGEMVSFSAVENSIMTLWPDYLHAVVSLSDDKKGEQLVLMTNYPKAERKDIMDYMKQEGYSELFIPKKIQIIDEMPVLGSGKIDYPTLQAMLLK